MEGACQTAPPACAPWEHHSEKQGSSSWTPLHCIFLFNYFSLISFHKDRKWMLSNCESTKEVQTPTQISFHLTLENKTAIRLNTSFGFLKICGQKGKRSKKFAF
jgi:hypothetical protein